MLTRETGYLTLRRPGSGSVAAKHLQAEGYVILEQVFSATTVNTLADEVRRIYEEYRDAIGAALDRSHSGAIKIVFRPER